MSFYGYGYPYPRAVRSVTFTKDWARAAVLNKKISKGNKWLEHLRETGAYDQIGSILRDAAASYRKKFPDKAKDVEKRRSTALSRELAKLEKARSAIESYGPDIIKEENLAPEDLAYALSKIQSEIDKIKKFMPVQPKGSGYYGYGYFY
ncbi:MAG: hypothetical protein NZZ41_07610 [Candidatus Dojkabacteria bacterium]|nr:hypothetical protein [Candidatus Dojkabacteria bacterium]